MSYIYWCKLCGSNKLLLHSIKFVSGPQIMEDGFGLNDGESGSTTDEFTICPQCLSIRPLENAYRSSQLPMEKTPAGYIIRRGVDWAEILSPPGPNRKEATITQRGEKGTFQRRKRIFEITIYRDIGENPFAWEHPITSTYELESLDVAITHVYAILLSMGQKDCP